MINCNPETVSTDYDTSDRLYFEPLTLEDVLNIVEKEKPLGVIVQFGGQTPLKLAVPLQRAGVPILGTIADAIDRAEDRQRFDALITELALRQAAGATARSVDEARTIAESIGYPVLVRPSYVLGGRAMEIVYDDQDLVQFVNEAVKVAPEHPVLIDKFLEDAIEIDVDAVSDGERVVIGGVMEHIEKAGVHSGDSACALPPYSLDEAQVAHPARPDQGAGQGARRGGAHQRAVRHPQRRHLRAGGEPARLAHGAVRLQGHRRAAGQDRHARHAGRERRRAGCRSRTSSAATWRSRSRCSRSSSSRRSTPCSAPR